MLGTIATAWASANSDRGISFCGITIACANVFVALITVKAAILFGIAHAFGIPRGNAIEVSLLLAQAGEFAFVVLAHTGGLVPPPGRPCTGRRSARRHTEP